MNGTKYLDFLKEKLDIPMVLHDCNVFKYYSAPCHWSKLIKKFLQEKKYQCPGIVKKQPTFQPDLYLWQVMKNKVVDQHPTRIESVRKTIKIVVDLKYYLRY